MAIKVIAPGLATTVQDLGRPGYYHLGIPLSGAMDRFALAAANLLVGNEEGAAGLEGVFMGPGDRVPARCDRRRCRRRAAAQGRWRAARDLDVLRGEGRAGALLRFPQAGRARLYRGIGRHRRAGGARLAARPIRSARSAASRAAGSGPATSCRSRAASGAAKRGRSVAPELRRVLGKAPELRVLPGLYWHRITEEAGADFFADTWKVAPEADRIGYRFRGGRPLEFVPRKQPFGAGSDPSNIVDACYPYGSIQVPGGTEPIVLHRDAVSGGGYFMVGTVISADMDLIGQLQPHHRVRFVKVDMAAALKARAERRALAARLKDSLS